MPEHLAQERTMSVGSRHCTMQGEVECGDKTCMWRIGPLMCLPLYLASRRTRTGCRAWGTDSDESRTSATFTACCCCSQSAAGEEGWDGTVGRAVRTELSVLSCTDAVRALPEQPCTFLGEHQVRSSSHCCVLCQQWAIYLAGGLPEGWQHCFLLHIMGAIGLMYSLGYRKVHIIW